MKVIAFTFNEGNGRRKIQRPSLIDCTEELPDDCTTPTRVHQRLSQNNLRKRQISCEITAELSK